MRLGVIDVGSNTVHLLVVDAHPGAQPLPASKHKIDLRLSEHVTDDGLIADEGRDRLADFVQECLDVAEDQGVEDLSGFVTSAIREAPNGDEVLAAVVERTGVSLDVLSGEEEARLTFLAARRWFGWSAGTLLVADIGGGSLELAQGMDEDPDVALSLPLGAGRVTRDLLPADPPGKDDRARGPQAGARHDRRRAAPARQGGAPPTTRSARRRRCARWPGSAARPRAPRGCTPRAPSSARRSRRACPRSPAMSAARARASCPGCRRRGRASCSPGAIVAEATMDLLGLDRLEICPWALREGIILRHLDRMS